MKKILEKQNKEQVKTTKKTTVNQKKKIILNIIIVAVLIYVVYAIYLLIKEPTNIFTIEEGTLYQEETDIGYVIRKETVVRGNNYKNGMEQIKAEGERAATPNEESDLNELTKSPNAAKSDFFKSVSFKYQPSPMDAI